MSAASVRRSDSRLRPRVRESVTKRLPALPVQLGENRDRPAVVEEGDQG